MKPVTCTRCIGESGRTFPQLSVSEKPLPEPAPDPVRIEQFVCRFVQTPTVLVHVSRAVGGEFELPEAARLVCAYVGQGEIHIAARDLSALVVIGQPGVGAGVVYPLRRAAENAC
jgi:hypothetical protein